MGMMHSEMEMVESIKQSEDNMTTVSARIERVKVRALGCHWGASGNLISAAVLGIDPAGAGPLQGADKRD